MQKQNEGQLPKEITDILDKMTDDFMSSKWQGSPLPLWFLPCLKEALMEISAKEPEIRSSFISAIDSMESEKEMLFGQVGIAINVFVNTPAFVYAGDLKELIQRRKSMEVIMSEHNMRWSKFQNDLINKRRSLIMMNTPKIINRDN